MLLLIGTAGACLLPIGPHGTATAQTINGAVPPTQVPTGTVVAVTGDSTPALLSQGDTGGVPNGIVVVGGGGITASNLSGTSIGVVSALAGGTIDLGTGTLVQAEGSGSPPGIIGATGLLARDLGAGGRRLSRKTSLSPAHPTSPTASTPTPIASSLSPG